MLHAIRFLTLTLFLKLSATAGLPTFERQEIDDAIAIGYGLAIGDVDGDAKPDILLADKSQIAWYRNGDWERFVMAENLNPRVGVRFLDNVCIAARDLDGDGKVEVAVGGNWNPGETADKSKSGSVHYLVRPEDPTGLWKPVQLDHDPTVHRMHWVRPSAGGGFQLVVLPLHGIGNKGGEGEPVKVTAHAFPDDPTKGPWETALVDQSMNATHNFDVAASAAGGGEGLLIAGAQGVVACQFDGEKWRSKMPIEQPLSRGAGEVRVLDELVATIEPMHGNEVVLYSRPSKPGGGPARTVLDDSFKQGHALAFADFDGDGEAEVVAGWRNPNADGKVGIKIYQLVGDKWQASLLDDNGMACEDLKVADLDGDGRPDVIAAGRATKNVVIYWNQAPEEAP